MKMKKKILNLVGLASWRGGEYLKDWECVQLGHHKNIGKTIEEWERNGWRLHTYQAQGTPTLVNHYLLFERESETK